MKNEKGGEYSHVTWVPPPHVPGMLTHRYVMRISLSKRVKGKNKLFDS
jgi:hypothetical protein